MNSNSKSHSINLQPIRHGGETKQAGRVQIRKVPYRVGYTWNKGGRLKELRIRHLARKFLKLWQHNTFGRILPWEARWHHDRSLQILTFDRWKSEWWTCRREWGLTLRAECHHRYHLYIWTLRVWKDFVTFRKKRKDQEEKAQLLVDRRLINSVWAGWRNFTEMMRLNKKNLECALEQKSHSKIHSGWSLWRTRFKQQQDLHTAEKQFLKLRAHSVQSKYWMLWKKTHKDACCQEEKDTKAILYFTLKLKKKSICQWKDFVAHRLGKRKSQAVAEHFRCQFLLKIHCDKWREALDTKQRNETRFEVANYLGIQSVQRRALTHWKAYVVLCREKAERDHLASQHFEHHLLCTGLRGFILNIKRSKDKHHNNKMAVQHNQQAIVCRFWKLWNNRLEAIEDKCLKPRSDMACSKYRKFVLKCFFHHWKERHLEKRRMQKLEDHADMWFAHRTLPHCFKCWIEFTQQTKLHKLRIHKADVYNRERLYTWVFYNWWDQSEERKTEALTEQTAILHKEQRLLRGAWARWTQRTQQQSADTAKREASQRLYAQQLLRKTISQWKESCTELRDRRGRERHACRQGDMRCLRLAVERWKQFVQIQRTKKCKLMEIEHYHQAKLLEQAFVAWKKHHLQMSEILELAKGHFRQQTHTFLREVFMVWWEKASLLADSKAAEEEAERHFKNVLQGKVFAAWREAATRAVSKRCQQRDAFIQIQISVNQVRLLRYFRQWRKRTRDFRRERRSMERARRHHNSRVLTKALTAWNKHHSQVQRNKVMKRQGILLLRLKMCQTYFEQWRIKLHYKQREAKQTERALWHWSLTLQAKVLCKWQLWVKEERSKREEAVKAAQVYRDRLLREGVSCILTYAAHMNDLTTTFTQFSQQPPPPSVKRCAARWKQRALSKPPKGKNDQPKPTKKSVTFCLSVPTQDGASLSDAAGCEAEDQIVMKLNQLEIGHNATRDPQKPPVSGHSSPEPHEARECHGVAAGAQTQDLLLPPSAFMMPRTSQAFEQFTTSTTGVEMQKQLPISSGTVTEQTPSKPDISAYPDESTLTRELVSIQRDMRNFQQGREQLRKWRKLMEVLQSWLQMSGKEEEKEQKTVLGELKELEEQINKLSKELDSRKPTMLSHSERIRHLQSVLRSSRVSRLPGRTEEQPTI